MADNPTVTLRVLDGLENAVAGSGAVATDDISSVHHQYVKLEFGADGTATKVSASDPLPVTHVATATANVDGSQVSVTTGAGGVQLLASNASRKGFILYFAGSCYVSWGGTPTSSSFLVPGGSVLEMLSGLIYTGEIKALSVSGTVLVHRVEF